MVINSIVDSRSVHQPLPRAGNQPRAGAATVPRTRPCNPELSSPRRDRDPESLPSCVVIVLGPNPQNPAPPPMGGPPPSRGRRRRRHGSGASLVFWDGRRGVNRGSPGERGPAGRKAAWAQGAPSGRGLFREREQQQVQARARVRFHPGRRVLHRTDNFRMSVCGHSVVLGGRTGDPCSWGL